MDLLKAILPEALDPRDLVPDGLLPYFFDGGVVLIGAVALGFFVLALKAAHDALKKRIEGFFGDGRILGMTLGYAAACVIALAGRHLVSLALVAMVVLAAATNVRGVRDHLLRPVGIVAQILLFLCLLVGEALWAERNSVRTAYVVVLAFDHSRPNDSEVTALSKEYLLVLRDAFRDVESTRIVPENPTALERLSLRSAQEQAVVRQVLQMVPRRRFCPAIILRTHIVFDEPNLRMTTNIHGVDRGKPRLGTSLDWMPAWGEKSSVQYPVFVMSLALLDKLRQLSCDTVLATAKERGAMWLTEKEERTVRRNILRAFQQFLDLRGDTSGLKAAVQAALDTNTENAAEVAALLGRYKGPIPASVVEVKVQKERCAAAAKLGGKC